MLQRAQGGLYRAVVHDVRDGLPVAPCVVRWIAEAP